MAEESTILNYVSILALRPLQVTSQAQSGVNMHRILQSDQLYMLHSGLHILDDKITIDLIKPQNLYNINQRGRETSVKINFSAIVGENGSGKSTIIDYIIRIINNLSAVLFGEYYYSKSAEHLHYINDVYAELFVLVDGTIFGITCRGMSISIDRYEFKECSEDRAIFEKNTEESKEYKTKPDEPCKEKNELFELLSKFCYTMVVNNSLYSFDISTYLEELTTTEKELKINNQGNKERYTTKKLIENENESNNSSDLTEFVEARSWLPGILNKYDGYRVPLMITPNRYKGQVDQRKEYINGKERLLSLSILRDKNNKRVFTKINKKEIIEEIKLKLDPASERLTYYSIFDDSFPNLSKTMRLCLYTLVRNTLSINYDIYKTYKKNDEIAWYYTVYKFFDIVKTYPELKEYRLLFQTLTDRLDTKTIDLIKKVIKEVCNIHNPATRLFMRSLYYLKFNLLDQIPQTSQSGSLVFSIDDISEKAYSIKKQSKSIRHVDELLPPPFFNLDFILYSDDDTNKENIITFESLSSGEKQITLLLSKIYYYLTNLDSISSKEAKTTKSESKEINEDKIISYRHVCVIFDELELYFHPEMQRTFISRLLAGLKQLSFKQIESIQFILVTHSPFILSDVPHKNVLFLDKKGTSVQGMMHTFGANIHSMLESSFFLENGSIGAYAKSVIGKIEACLNIYNIYSDQRKESEEKKISKISGLMKKEGYKFLTPFIEKNNKRLGFNYDKFCSCYSNESIKAAIELFDDPIIKNVLLHDYYEAFPLIKNEDHNKRKRKLEIQLSSLKKVAEENPDNKDVKELISDLNSQLKTLENEQ
ncbi:MAG: AAA family ATPase [Paludibacteraceae bacterium]|nr:AAA family ATPase [Paludibacteraceae bacterium]